MHPRRHVIRALFGALGFLSALVLLPVPARAAVPTSVNFQGRLTTPNGAPVADTTSQNLTFRLYDAPAGGAVLWLQSVNNVEVKDGAFSALLDFSTGFTAGNTLESSLAGTPFVEVSAGADPPMTPRLPLTATPYALRAAQAETALSARTVSDGSITGAKLAPGALDGGKPATLRESATSLVQQGAIGTQAGAESVAVSGGMAYVANVTANTLQIFNVSDPTTPVLKGGVGTGGNPECVVVSGHYAYVVSSGNRMLQIFDVSDPAAPALAGKAGTGNGPKSVAVSAGYAYVPNYNDDTLDVFDVSDPTAPFRVGRAATGDFPRAVAVSGNTVFVANFIGKTIQAFDVSNPTAPTSIGSVGTATGPIAIAVSGSHAYVTAFNDGKLQVFDVSDPTAPVLEGSANTGVGVSGVAVSGTNAYVVNNSLHSVSVFDVGDSSTPTGLASVNTGNYPNSLAVSGDHAYVVSFGDSDLRVYGIGFQLHALDNVRVDGSLALGGNVGISTAPGAFPLTIGSNTLGDKISLYGQSGAHYGLGIQAGTLQVHTDQSGASVVFGYGQSTAMTETARIQGNGDIRAQGDVYARGVKLTSDARFKTNVQTLDNALDTVLGLRGVTFEWDRADWPDRNFVEGLQVGFIAQEVERVLPEVVSTDADGYKSVAYQNVVPVLVEALKAQQKRIDTLEERLQRLEERAAAPPTTNR